MLSAVITALLLCMMLLIVSSIIISVLLERRRHARMLVLQAQESRQSPDRRVTLVLQLQDGTLLGVEKPAPPSTFTLPSSWYTRHRMLVTTGLLMMMLLTLFVQSGIVDGALQQISQGITLLSFAQHTTGMDLNTASHQAPGIPLTASQRLVRVNSADRRQYYSDYQWNVWSYSSDLMMLLTLFVQSGIVDGALQQISQGITLLSFAQHTTGMDLNTASHQAPGIPLTASQRLVRVNSADRRQYYSDYQWNVWSYS